MANEGFEPTPDLAVAPGYTETNTVIPTALKKELIMGPVYARIIRQIGLLLSLQDHWPSGYYM